jgi:hypothetical protein
MKSQPNGWVLRIAFYMLICVNFTPFVPTYALAQSDAGSSSIYESRCIVDMPTAGVLPKNTYCFEGTTFTNGGLLASFTIAPLKNLNLGISFSGTNLIGSGDIKFQKWPGFILNWRIIDETRTIPAILIGVNTQGRGEYISIKNRFETYSTGIYTSLSKSFKWSIGNFSWHAGLNYTFEQAAGQHTPNFWIGFEHSIGAYGALYFELNPNLADKDRQISSASVLLNIGTRWSIARGVTIELKVRDLLENSRIHTGFERWAGISYIRRF